MSRIGFLLVFSPSGNGRFTNVGYEIWILDSGSALRSKGNNVELIIYMSWAWSDNDFANTCIVGLRVWDVPNNKI